MKESLTTQYSMLGARFGLKHRDVLGSVSAVRISFVKSRLPVPLRGKGRVMDVEERDVGVG